MGCFGFAPFHAKEIFATRGFLPPDFEAGSRVVLSWFPPSRRQVSSTIVIPRLFRFPPTGLPFVRPYLSVKPPDATGVCSA